MYTNSVGGKEQLTIAKTPDAIHCRHFDDECEHVIDECVEGLVREHPPGEMGHRLQLVVDKQLRCHGNESWYII